VRQIEKFVDYLSNWYVRRNRRRFWKSGSDDDKRAAYTTLYYCLVSLSRLMAPFAPFISEEVYRNLVCAVDTDAAESVHLTDFPVADHTKVDLPLMRATRLVMTVCSMGRAARARAGIKVRQPLARIVVSVDSREEEEDLQKLSLHVKEELNVKEVELVQGQIPGKMPGYVILGEGERSVAIFTELSPELLSEGISREVVRYIQNMRRAAGFEIADHIITYFQTDAVVIKRAMHDFAGYVSQETLSDGVVEGFPSDDAYDEKHRISGSEILLAVKKVS
jgi:isoleucyl-tRNA synthetase